jgi:hypothetical protein
MSCKYQDSGIDFLTLGLVDLRTIKNSSYKEDTSYPKHCLNSSAIQEQIVGVYHDYPVPIVLHYGCPGMVTGEHDFEEIRFIANHSNIFSGQVIDYWFSNNSGYLDQGKWMIYAISIVAIKSRFS